MARVKLQEYMLSTGETVTIRSALPEDAQAIIDLMMRVFQEQRFHISTPADFTTSAPEQGRSITSFLDDPGKLMLVAEHGGQIVGMLEFENDGRRRMQHRGTVWISISGDFRGRNLGTLLSTHGWWWAIDNPLIEKVCMQVLHTNERSLALCKKMGFCEEARLRQEVKLGEGRYADLVILSRFVREPGGPIGLPEE